MAIPTGIATVVVTGRYIRPDGTPLSGTVTFEPPPRLTFPSEDTIGAGAATVALDGTGAFLLTLIATDVPGMQPEGWTYTVTERMVRAPERTYHIALPSATPAVDLADIAPANPNDGNYVLVTGPPGKDGSQILTGAGAPSAATGATGDFYVDTTAGDVKLYGPKAGTWPSTPTVLGGLTQTSADARYARSGRGIHVPPGWGAKWRAARDAAATGGKARVVCVGDSVTHGFFASNLFTTSWTGRVRNSLQGQYGDGGLGYFGSMTSRIAGHDEAICAAWEAAGCLVTNTGTWTGDTSSVMGPGIYSVDSTVTGSSLTFPARGSTVKVYTITGGTGRSGYTYSIDGGTPVAVADGGGGGAANIQVTTIAGLSTGSHTVTIAHNGTSGQKLSVCGVGSENDSGVVVSNVARSGARSGGYAVPAASSLNAVWNGGSAYPADLVIYSLGLNDAAANTTGDAWAANVAKYLQAVRGSGDGSTDLLIIMQHIGTHEGTNAKWQDYEARARGLAATYDAALIDMWALGRNSWNYWDQLGAWGTPTTPGASGHDTVHLSDVGQALIADQVTPLLLS
jgi:lysophospholipase L1-like esterase